MNNLQEALKRIKDAKNNNSSILNLSGLKLTTIPKEIEELQNLTKLNINDNKITNPTPISKLQNLTELSISFNKITDPTPNKQTSKLNNTLY